VPGRSGLFGTNTGGASFGSPSGLPALLQASSVLISSSERRMSPFHAWRVEHSSVSRTAKGGIVPALVVWTMSAATALASSYEVRLKGAILPAEWQPMQLFCRMGSTSL
jgi:hypothetical protein